MRALVGLFGAFVLIVAAACAAGAAPPSPGATVPPVVRTVLAAGHPSAAPDRNLELVRYTIQPGTALPPHRHPGTQLAYIESGTLAYTVIEGEVVINQADGGSRVIRPGATGTVEAGEWIMEHEGIVHFGANDGDVPVVILASSLLEADEPPAIPVASASPSAS